MIENKPSPLQILMTEFLQPAQATALEAQVVQKLLYVRVRSGRCMRHAYCARVSAATRTRLCATS